MKYFLQYKCKKCGGVHTTEKSDEWQRLDHPPFIASKPVTNLVMAATGVIVPNMIMWHACIYDGEQQYGIAEFVGLVPDTRRNDVG